jgi:hypothetical protein
MGGCIILRGNHLAEAEFSQIESIIGAKGRQIYLYVEPDLGIWALALGVPYPVLKSW